ncbi:MAG: hypothetical protein ABEI32_06365 [Halothece sp.]
MTVSNRPQRIESNADQMINSLFTEIDQMLEQGNDFQSCKGKNKQNVSLESTEGYQDTQGKTSWGDAGNFPHQDQSSNPLLKPAPEEFVSFPDFADESYRRRRKETDQVPLWIRHLDKIVFSSSCSLFLGILFFLQKEEKWAGFNLTQLSNQISLSKSSNPPAIDSNQKFLSYMERALAEINREKKRAEQPEPKKQPIQPVQPVQPRQSPQRNQSTVVSSLPALPPPPPATQQPTAAPTPSPTNTAPSPPANNFTKANSSATSETKQNPSPSPSTKEATNVSPSPEANATAEKTTPLPNYTLVGLLELGDHSAALLKMKETTQRVMLGETIPGSNWKLVSIANQKATFEKNSQKKSMSVGQTTSAK